MKILSIVLSVFGGLALLFLIYLMGLGKGAMIGYNEATKQGKNCDCEQAGVN